METNRIVHHSYRSPLLGAHDYHIRHKTQYDTTTRTDYGYHPHQRTLSTGKESTAVADTMKLEGRTKPEHSVTKNVFSAPSEKQPSNLFYGPGIAMPPPIAKTPKELANDYRYISNAFITPGPKSGASNYSTMHRRAFSPLPEEYYRDRQLYHKNLQVSNIGIRDLSLDPKSEYAKCFVKQNTGGGSSSSKVEPETGYTNKSLYSCHPIGPAKLNVTHNTITGDRFNWGERKIGTTCHNDTYCIHPLVSNTSCQKINRKNQTSTSIPQGDPNKEYQTQSLSQASYQDPLSRQKHLRFSTVDDVTARRSLGSSVILRENKCNPSMYTSLSQNDFQRHDIKPSVKSKCWWSSRIHSFPKGDLDPVRVRERYKSNSKINYLKPPEKFFAEVVDKHVSDSSLCLGSRNTRGLRTFITVNSATYKPYSKQSCQHIMPPPKDKLNIKFSDDDYVQSSNMTHAFPYRRPVHPNHLSLKIKNALDYKSHWSLPFMGKPTYSTTHKENFCNPAVLAMRQ